VAGGADIGVLAPQPRRVEAGTVRVDVPTADGGVAGQTITLDMAPYARLQTLPRRLAVACDEELLGIVVASPQRPSRHQPRRGVAARTEAPDVVAVTARGLPRVGRRGVAGEKTDGVIPRRSGRLGAMALETVGPDVTPGAGRRRRGRRAGVAVGEVRPVRGGRLPPRDRQRPRVACQRSDGRERRLIHVTLEAEVACAASRRRRA